MTSHLIPSIFRVIQLNCLALSKVLALYIARVRFQGGLCAPRMYVLQGSYSNYILLGKGKVKESKAHER